LEGAVVPTPLPSPRIQQTSIVTSVDRQTPNNAFGAVLARTVGSALHRGTAMAGGVISRVPVASAAVAGVNHVVGSVLPVSSPGGPEPLLGSGGWGGSIGSGGGGEGAGGPWELLQAQRVMMKESVSLNGVYLELQRQMEGESRQFNTLSNVMKVRHDSAKSAINNIR
jgi:hypothetical protein